MEHYFDRIFDLYLSSRKNLLKEFILEADELADLLYKLFLLSLRNNQAEAVAFLRCLDPDGEYDFNSRLNEFLLRRCPDENSKLAAVRKKEK